MPAPSFVTRPYRLSTSAVLQQLRVKDDTGLSWPEAASRATETENMYQKPPLYSLIGNSASWSIGILLLFTITFAIKEDTWSETILASSILVCFILLRFFFQLTGHRSYKEIYRPFFQTVNVLRSGEMCHLPARQLVVGDILILAAGQLIPSDARLLMAHGLVVDESTLTDQITPIKKNPGKLDSRTPISDQKNMLWAGTRIINGSGTAIVITIGRATEYGKKLQATKTMRHLPLIATQNSFNNLIVLLILTFTISLAIFIWNILTRVYSSAIFPFTLAMFGGAVPATFSVILTLSLIYTARLFRKNGILFHSLSSLIALPYSTIFCFDIDNALEKDETKAFAFDCLQGEIIKTKPDSTTRWSSLGLIGLTLSNDIGMSENHYASHLDVVPLATRKFLSDLGFSPKELNQKWQEHDRLSYNPSWHYHASLHSHPTQATQVLFVSGVPAVLLDHSSHALDHDGAPVLLTSERRQEIQRQFHTLSDTGEYLVAVAIRRHFSRKHLTREDIHELTFIGVLRFVTSVHSDTRHALQYIQNSGIDIVGVSNNDTPTARAIARSCGLTITNDSILSGSVMSDLTDKELNDHLPHTKLFTELTPLDRERIVRLLQKKGERVVMAGSHTSDVLALSAADVGICGPHGTILAKAASSFSSNKNIIITTATALELCRAILHAMQKALGFFLTVVITLTIILLANWLANSFLPLTALQALVVGVVINGILTLTITTEPGNIITNQHKKVLQQPLLTNTLFTQTLLSGIILAILAIGLSWFLGNYLALDQSYIQTMLFAFLATALVVMAINFRSFDKTCLKPGFISNAWFTLISLFIAIFLIAAIYTPTLKNILGTTGLYSNDWLLVIALAIEAIVLIDQRKNIPTDTKQNSPWEKEARRDLKETIH